MVAIIKAEERKVDFHSPRHAAIRVFTLNVKESKIIAAKSSNARDYIYINRFFRKILDTSIIT